MAAVGSVVVSGVWAAATRRLNLFMVSTVTATSACLHSWPLFIAAMGSYGAVIAVDLSRRSHWSAVLERLRRRPPRLPHESELTDPTARRLLARLAAARASRECPFERARVKRMSIDVTEQMVAVERSTIAILEELDGMALFLAEHGLPRARAEASFIAGEVARTTIPELKAVRENALSATTARLVALERVDARRQLLTARAEAMLSTMEMVPACLLRRATAGEEDPAADEAMAELLRAAERG